MPYLNLDVDFFTHRKTIRLIGRLGQAAIGLPLRLWAYAAKHHCEDGMLVGYQDAELEMFMNWTGENGFAIAALVEVGFIDKVDGGYQIHDWSEHAGHLVAFKKRAKSASKARWKRYASSIAKKKVSIATSTPKHDFCNAPNLPNLLNLKIGSEPVKAATPPVEEWLENLKKNPAYSHVDWAAQLGKMQAWLSLPKNKHRKLTQSFILNWVNKIEKPFTHTPQKRQPAL